MIIFLTIAIAIFIVVELGAILICLDNEYTDFKDASILVKLSRILLWSEAGLLGIGILLFISYLFASAIVCSSTNGDYKGCTEIKESVAGD